jgi:hypothetical protein
MVTRVPVPERAYRVHQFGVPRIPVASGFVEGAFTDHVGHGQQKQLALGLTGVPIAALEAHT